MNTLQGPRGPVPFWRNLEGPQQLNPTKEDCLEAICFLVKMGDTSLWEGARSRVTTYSCPAVHCTVPGVSVRDYEVTVIPWYRVQ